MPYYTLATEAGKRPLRSVRDMNHSSRNGPSLRSRYESDEPVLASRLNTAIRPHPSIPPNPGSYGHVPNGKVRQSSYHAPTSQSRSKSTAGGAPTMKFRLSQNFADYPEYNAYRTGRAADLEGRARCGHEKAPTADARPSYAAYAPMSGNPAPKATAPAEVIPQNEMLRRHGLHLRGNPDMILDLSEMGDKPDPFTRRRHIQDIKQIPGTVTNIYKRGMNTIVYHECGSGRRDSPYQMAARQRDLGLTEERLASDRGELPHGCILTPPRKKSIVFSAAFSKATNNLRSKSYF